MKTNMKLLKTLMKMKQDELYNTLKRYISEKYEITVIRNKFIIGVGDIPIGLVAHLDTVHKFPPTTFFFDRDNNVLWSPDGLGADDRAGVYAIIQIIEAGYRPHVIFCKDEEKGGIGAQELILNFPECPFENLKCLIELDRSGKNDCVFYDCDNKVFNKYIEGFGFKTDEGSFSDICIIAPTWQVAAVNLSVGYYEEHSFAEFLCITYLSETIEKVKKILDAEPAMNNYSYVPRLYRNYKKSKCIFCDKILQKNEGLHFYSNDMRLSYDCCPSCYSANYDLLV